MHDAEHIEKVTAEIGLFVPPILMVIGLIGNMQIIAILFRKEMKYLPTTPYFIALAIVDLILIVIGLTDIWLYFGLKSKALDGPVYPRITQFCIYGFMQMDAWLIVAVTFDRLVYICFRLKASMIQLKHRIIFIISILTIISALNFHILLFPWTSITSNDSSNYAYFRNVVWPKIDLAIACIIPFTLLASWNSVIIIKSLQRNKKKKLSSKFSKTIDKNIHKKNLLLVAISAVFIITYAPTPLLNVYQQNFDMNNSRTRATFFLVYLITACMQYINPLSNFFIYYLLENTFRNAFNVRLSKVFAHRRSTTVGLISEEQSSTKRRVRFQGTAENN